ncbi:hypothetical protein GYA44_03155 [Candidatus Microgenomates bacterium]|nr:hypothetical protein [Candidatus Microgenomates bacterium]
MKITKLASQKKDPSRVSMFLDNQFFCGISLDIVAKYSLYVGKEIADLESENIFKDEIQNRFLSRSVDYIARGPKTQFQVKKYLRELSLKQKGKWYSDISKEKLEDTIEYVLRKLNEYGYIDDGNFALLFVQSRIKNKPRGKAILISELLSKGVSRDIAEEKVNELVEDEYSMLKKVYEKKFKQEKITFEDRKKIDFLLRKGFNWDLIEQFINEFTD